MASKVTKLHDSTQSSTALLLTKEVASLTKEIAKLKDQDFIQVFAHPWKFIWYSFLKGLMVGFGSVLGASVLVALFIYMLAQIRLVPVLGDFVQDVIDQIQIKQEIQTENSFENSAQNTNIPPAPDSLPKTSNP